jgi:hypothetical protein
LDTTSGSAGKQDAGYPRSYAGFYLGFDARLPEMAIDEDHRSAKVSVRWGRRAGWLSGSVVDDADGKVFAKLLGSS